MLQEKKIKSKIKKSSELQRASLIVNDFMDIGFDNFIDEISRFYSMNRRLLIDMVIIKLSQYSLDNIEIESIDLEFLARASALSLMSSDFNVSEHIQIEHIQKMA